jgi:hypothetical protein
MEEHIKGLRIELTNLPYPSFSKRGIPPFGKGRPGGICQKDCRYDLARQYRKWT